MRLKNLINILDSGRPKGLVDFEIKGISCNSKTVKPGFIFVAIKGVKQDGSKYIDEAINRGAGALVIQSHAASCSSQVKIPFITVKDSRCALAKLATEFYGNASSKIKVVGVTGTNGKTTITYLIENILRKAKTSPAVIGTINYRFKNKSVPSKNTTPGPVELQAMLADMLKSSVNYAIMEVSSHALDQDRTQGVRFHSAIFTNLTQDHLDYHKTIGNYFQAKAKLFRSLDAKAFAVINNDDKYGRRLKGITKAHVITYGIKNKSQVRAENIKFDARNSEFTLNASGRRMHLKTKLIGTHNIYNILAAVAWAKQAGISDDKIKRTIEEFSLVPGRLERVALAKKFSVFVDYAHTHDALKNIIKSLREVSKKRIIVVFGCGGERDKTKRPKMGRVVTQLSDYAIITNDNPRSEDPQAIIRDIKRGISKNNFCVIPERCKAIKKSLTLANEGDVVLIAGKGHENYQVLKDKVIHFDDREWVRKCLQSMNC